MPLNSANHKQTWSQAIDSMLSFVHAYHMHQSPFTIIALCLLFAFPIILIVSNTCAC